MEFRESPFVFEEAVSGDMFFDRRWEIDFFESNLRVKRKILLCIVAPLKYGKTSLMLKYFEIVKRFSDIIPIYINLKTVNKPIRFIVESLKRFGVNLTKEYELALSEGYLLKLFEKINEVMEAKKSWLFLFFDEFQFLPKFVKFEGFFKEFDDVDIFSFFRGYAEGRRISYIVCGSVIEPLLDALDVWGGRFEIIYLGPFDEEEAVNMLVKLFEKGGLKIDFSTAREIAEAAGFHPFYIQYMGHQIFSKGKVDRRSIMYAKRRLFEYILPIFETQLSKIISLGKDFLNTLKKVIYNDKMDIEDRARLAKLIRMGIVKPENNRYVVVDPLFERYLKQIVDGLETVEVTIVGHWAERIVGNYLLKKGYTPYYSHDSRGAFDIYTKIGETDVGIQVRYSSNEEIYLSGREVEEIKNASKEMGWKPMLAIVQKEIRFFSDIREGKYIISEGSRDIEEAVFG